MNFKGIIKLTKTQYDTLMSTGQCIDSQGVTHTYQDGYIYTCDDIDYMPVVDVPASASATGTAGQIAYDSSYIYICVATNTWMRAALATW